MSSPFACFYLCAGSNLIRYKLFLHIHTHTNAHKKRVYLTWKTFMCECLTLVKFNYSLFSLVLRFLKHFWNIQSKGSDRLLPNGCSLDEADSDHKNIRMKSVSWFFKQNTTSCPFLHMYFSSDQFSLLAHVLPSVTRSLFHFIFIYFYCSPSKFCHCRYWFLHSTNFNAFFIAMSNKIVTKECDNFLQLHISICASPLPEAAAEYLSQEPTKYFFIFLHFFLFPQ